MGKFYLTRVNAKGGSRSAYVEAGCLAHADPLLEGETIYGPVGVEIRCRHCIHAEDMMGSDSLVYKSLRCSLEQYLHPKYPKSWCYYRYSRCMECKHYRRGKGTAEKPRNLYSCVAVSEDGSCKETLQSHMDFYFECELFEYAEDCNDENSPYVVHYEGYKNTELE